MGTSMNLMGIDEPDGSFQGTRLLAPGADGVVPAPVAAHALSRLWMNGRRCRRTDIQAGSAADATLGIGVDPSPRLMTESSVHGADIDTGGFVTRHTNDRNIFRFFHETPNPDSGIGFAPPLPMTDGACHNTAHAAVAAFGIDQGNLHALISPFQPSLDRGPTGSAPLCRCCRSG